MDGSYCTTKHQIYPENYKSLFLFFYLSKNYSYFLFFKYIHASNEAIYGLEFLKCSYPNLKNVPDCL